MEKELVEKLEPLLRRRDMLSAKMRNIGALLYHHSWTITSTTGSPDKGARLELEKDDLLDLVNIYMNRIAKLDEQIAAL
jgi:hypothetical protein